MSDEDLVERFEAAKAQRETLLERKSKLEVAQQVASQKRDSLLEEVRELGLEPEKLDEWVASERKRLQAEMTKYEEQAAAAEAELAKIEASVKDAAG